MNILSIRWIALVIISTVRPNCGIGEPQRGVYVIMIFLETYWLVVFNICINTTRNTVGSVDCDLCDNIHLHTSGCR